MTSFAFLAVPEILQNSGFVNLVFSVFIIHYVKLRKSFDFRHDFLLTLTGSWRILLLLEGL
jgi:hypothetical protein